MKGQHDLARRWRLNRGGCPKHGNVLTIVTTVFDLKGRRVFFVVCPRKDCSFSGHFNSDSKVYKALKDGFYEQNQKVR